MRNIMIILFVLALTGTSNLAAAQIISLKCEMYPYHKKWWEFSVSPRNDWFEIDLEKEVVLYPNHKSHPNNVFLRYITPTLIILKIPNSSFYDDISIDRLTGEAHGFDPGKIDIKYEGSCALVKRLF